ncbi:MAG: universal stress protein [Chloroflexi bacterium]|jgi:nucleotide-binding universal stress UspA family protein|nr:universal stress protein [Chloroflexota bacterium]
MLIQKWLFPAAMLVGGLVLGYFGSEIVVDTMPPDSQDSLGPGSVLGGVVVVLLFAIPVAYIVLMAVETIQSTHSVALNQQTNLVAPVIASKMRRVLISFGNGCSVQLALQLAAPIVGDSMLTLLRVVSPTTNVDVEREITELHRQAAEVLGPDRAVQAQVAVSDSVVSAVLEEAAQGYDLLVFGESEEKGPRKWFANMIPDKIIERAPCSVVIVHQREQASAA